MNLRTLKKRCRRAMDTLIAEHGYRRDDFSMADGEETLDAPPRLERQFVRRGFVHPGPLKGTPLYWTCDPWGSGECECYFPSEILSDVIFWSTLTDAGAKAMLEPRP